MRKNHHLISKVTINKIRELYLKGNFSRRAAGRLLKISACTVANYVKQFKKMEELYPGKIHNNRFFLPSEIRLPHLPKENYYCLHCCQS